MPRPARDPVLAALAAFEYRPTTTEAEAPAWPPAAPDPFFSREQAVRYVHNDLKNLRRDELLAEIIIAALAVRTTTVAWWAERWTAVLTEWRKRHAHPRS